ncbi:MAG: FAD-binding oxidoreductase [Pseudomonadota bacterium]
MAVATKLDRIVEPLAYSDVPNAENFWRTTHVPAPVPRLERPDTCDVAVIGAGYTGLSAALRLAERGIDAAVLDAHGPGWGASGRNGGFCCLGGAALGEAKMIRRYGAQAAREHFALELRAIETVAGVLDTHGIDADRHSDGEVLLAHAPSSAAALATQAEWLRAQYGVAATVLPRDALAQHGMKSPEFHGALHVPLGFALNPLKYASGLADAARRAGARLFGQSPVLRIGREGGKHRLDTPGGPLLADRVIVATNGYSSENLPRWLKGRYLPKQSNILVTRPLTEDELLAQGWTSRRMCYDTRRHLHYFRLMPDNRVLFGVRGRVRVRQAAWDATRSTARADFERIFPAWRHVETPHFWQGLLCVSAKLTPYVGPIPGLAGGYAALAYHGNGMAMASLSGRLVADLATGHGRVPDVLAAPLARFPLGRHRRALLWAAAVMHRVQDSVGGLRS